MNPGNIKITISVLLAAALLTSAIGVAQTPIRVRGTVTAFDGNALSVKSQDGKTVDVQLGEKTNIVFTQPIALSDLKPGDFVGVSSARGGDGTLKAFEIRRFPKPVNPGHRPLDGREDQTMTNAAVSATVESSNGVELVLGYEGGSQKVIVAPNALVSTLVPGTRAQLVPDAPVNLTGAPDASGRLIATNIQVSKPGFTPKQ